MARFTSCAGQTGVARALEQACGTSEAGLPASVPSWSPGVAFHPRGKNFLPPRLMIYLLRPVICTLPCSSTKDGNRVRGTAATWRSAGWLRQLGLKWVRFARQTRVPTTVGPAPSCGHVVAAQRVGEQCQKLSSKFAWYHYSVQEHFVSPNAIATPRAASGRGRALDFEIA